MSIEKYAEKKKLVMLLVSTVWWICCDVVAEPIHSCMSKMHRNRIEIIDRQSLCIFLSEPYFDYPEPLRRDCMALINGFEETRRVFIDMIRSPQNSSIVQSPQYLRLQVEHVFEHERILERN